MKKLLLLDKDVLHRNDHELNQLRNEVKAAARFVQDIKTFNLASEYTGVLKDESLAKELIDLRQQLFILKEQEEQRNWVNEGLATFAALLRMHETNDLKEFFNKVLSKLVNYLGVNQGGLFVLNDDDESAPSLNLVACFAYERKKYTQRNIEPGEGLVGQCFLEKECIYMTDVPNDYVRITSGLGEALPRNILIVPLKLNEVVLGVLELASFQKFQPHQVDFVKKVSESIASAYSSYRVSSKTSRLLEESQEQAEQLRSQEEEMRQNMEEMQATQEEMKRMQLEMHAQTGIINQVAIVSKADVRGNITYVNEEFLKWAKYSREELIGKNHRMLKSGHQPDEVFKEMWQTISSGKIWRGEVKNRAKDGSYYWVDAIIAPVLGDHGKPIEYIAQRFVINDKKEKEEQMRFLLDEAQAKEEELRQNMEEMKAIQEEMEKTNQEMEAQTSIINSLAIVSKADLQGNITYVNEQFIEWSKYSREELIGQNHRILKSGHQAYEVFVDMWRTISSGKIWRGEVKNRAKDGTYYWVDAIIAPILGANGKPKEYIAQRFVLHEKTEQANEAQAQKDMVNEQAAGVIL